MSDDQLHMSERAAIVTGASRGIGLELAGVLGSEGYALTLAARRPESLEQAAASLRARGYDVQAVAGNLADESVIRDLIARHRDRFGRLDVLVNSAGIGVAAPPTKHQTRLLDIQFDVNLRSIVLFYREAIELLRLAGAEHRNALVVNLASMAGKGPQPGLSFYGAVKAGVIAYTASMNAELHEAGIKSVALCPAWVDTGMAEFEGQTVAREEMIRVEDIAHALRFLLRLSPWCLVPEIEFTRPGRPI
jgi:NAD(P)-dependent dehydrogenase (short-subunit alcohol dehydrogenase family)